jgi:hypothetical protein
MKNAISGKYTTKRDGGIAYTYEATWHRANEAFAWDAKVKRDGQLVGTPNGQLILMAGDDLAETVAALVCDSIEHRVGTD